MNGKCKCVTMNGKSDCVMMNGKCNKKLKFESRIRDLLSRNVSL